MNEFNLSVDFIVIKLKNTKEKNLRQNISLAEIKQ